MGRALLVSSILAAALALSWGGAMMYAAWEHNPQGRFHENGIIHWDQWLIIGGTHFLLGLLAALALVALFWLTALLFRPLASPKGRLGGGDNETNRHGT